ncbi:GAF domain-containing sensor histidine kinase, partial [candidate division WWE3 bacterium]|nr:GAF domain-containing sensor histidine kinase [candidate division WWE3 bacterium]
VAIENASLFSEVQAFNVKLRKEIARATDDLARKNQSLTILRHLDQVIISSLGIKEMAQKIVDTVSWELGYKGGFMILYDRDKKNLRATAVSNTPHYQKIKKMLPIELTDYLLPVDADPTNFIIRAINERRPLYTNDFKDMYLPAIPAEFADSIQKELGARHNLIYPLEAKGEVLGVIIFELKEKYTKLSEHEKSLLEAFIDESGIAINNAMLYEELQNLNGQLKNANQRLRELDQMKDELVSVASHELRTPMTAIKGYLWMALNKQQDQLNDKLKQYLSRSYESTERLIDLVNDMLSVSRLEGKRIELDKKPINLNEFVPTVLDDLMPKANEKHIELSFESAGKAPEAFADEIRLREILMNLTGNALKYTDSGKVWITAEEVAPHQMGVDKHMVQIGIHDTGQGIKEDDLKKLFTKFGKLQQGSFVKSSEEGGTGLGLYISKGLVDLHGGKIWAESKIGEGSTFAFTVELATDDLKQKYEKKQAEEAKLKSNQKKTNFIEKTDK